MSSPATSLSSKERIDLLFGEMEELAGQRNAIDSRLVEIAAEIAGDGIWGATGCRSVPALVAWKLGVSPHTAETIVTAARRLEEFPRCAAMMRDGQLSLDQVAVIAERAGAGSDAHYAQLASVATVTQLRTAIKLEPRPTPDRKPEPERSFRKIVNETSTTYRITLPKVEAAKFEAGLDSHRDALVAAWKRDHAGGSEIESGIDTGGEMYGGARHGENPDGPSVRVPPFPTTVDAFTSLVEAGWDADVARRPHGQHTTVVVHLDVENRNAALHLGSFLSEEDRRLLMCEADCEIWFERHGQVIGSGRGTRQISRRLRRALEHRDQCCVVPGLWGDPWSARSSPPALGGRRRHGAGQPGAAVPVPSPAAPRRRHHHHRPRPEPRRHRRRRQPAQPGIVGPPTDSTPTIGETLPRPVGGTRRVVVVHTV